MRFDVAGTYHVEVAMRSGDTGMHRRPYVSAPVSGVMAMRSGDTGMSRQLIAGYENELLDALEGDGQSSRRPQNRPWGEMRCACVEVRWSRQVETDGPGGLRAAVAELRESLSDVFKVAVRDWIDRIEKDGLIEIAAPAVTAVEIDEIRVVR
jgi:hypothetical protein